MGQNFQGKNSVGKMNYETQLKIKEIDDMRVEITNMGDKKVLISYHGVGKEIKQGESIIVLKMILENLNAKVI